MNIIFIYLAISTSIPDWVQQVPADDENSYFVGTATASSKQEALEKAWHSALFSAGERQFPELVRVASSSNEALTASHYERVAKNYFYFIDWVGIRESTELQSPVILFDEKDSQWKCYRLLRWDRTLLLQSKQKALSAFEENKPFENLTLPLSPEKRNMMDERLLAALKKLQILNAQTRDKNEFVFEVLKRTRCGITTIDLTGVLGPPDRIDHCFHYWGSFYVISCDPSQPVFNFEQVSQLNRYYFPCEGGKKS